MHQNAHNRLQVFLWDSVTHTYELGLSSQYNPIGVQLLPNGTGFSFIDNGIIKIKFFNKRSAKIVEIYEPLYNIAQMTWISETRFIFQAKRGNRYGIYQSDLDGNVSTIQADTNHDYGYPALADNILFYISKDASGTFRILRAQQEEKEEKVIYASEYPLMHLTMLGNNEGYVLEERKKGFTICYFKKEQHEWRFESIFYLQEGLGEFFDNNTSLCEMFRPFLPHKFKGMLILPLETTKPPFDLSYYDLEKRCSMGCHCSSFFLPPTIKNNLVLSSFGCPLIANDEIFVGLAINV